VSDFAELRADFEGMGWEEVCVRTMYDKILTDDGQILNTQLALDEYEEWQLIAKHYYFAILKSKLINLQQKK